MEGRGIPKAKHCARWRKQGEPAKAGCFKKLLALCLDTTDLLMEVRKLACALVSGCSHPTEKTFLSD